MLSRMPLSTGHDDYIFLTFFGGFVTIIGQISTWYILIPYCLFYLKLTCFATLRTLAAGHWTTGYTDHSPVPGCAFCTSSRFFAKGSKSTVRDLHLGQCVKERKPPANKIVSKLSTKTTRWEASAAQRQATWSQESTGFQLLARLQTQGHLSRCKDTTRTRGRHRSTLYWICIHIRPSVDRDHQTHILLGSVRKA